MRVLLLTPWPVLPPSHGGRLRAFRLAAGLVRAGAEVDIVCPWGPGQPRQEHSKDGVRIRSQLYAGLPLLAIDDYWLPSAVTISWQSRLPGARSHVRSMADYDIVQIDSSGYAPWLERAPAGVRRVFGSPNVEHDYAARRAQGAGRIRRAFAQRIARLESRAVAASDLVLACTDADARRFEELYSPSACAVVPNGFDDELLSLDRKGLRTTARAELGIGADEKVAFFVGSNADQNRRAVTFLEQDVAPQLGNATRLLIAGKAATALTQKDARTLGLGYVDDMKPLLAAADVALNPMVYGSGSNLKIAEYLAAGLPIVTTAVGARGFERWSDRMRIVELDDFAEAIDGSPAAGAPPDGIAELAWGTISERLHRLYADLAGR